MAADGEVRLRDLLRLLDKARRPVDAAYKSDEVCPEISFEEIREPLRAAYRLLDGDPDIEFKERSLQSRKTLPYVLAHFAASHIAQLAQAAIVEDSADLQRALLKRSRELVSILERYILGEEPAAGKNVVTFKRSRPAVQGDQGGSAA